MLNQLQKRKDQGGFTIIEVLIVLAIAGLILLIVFLAVPALQRNAHNTSAKNDVAGMLGAMNEYVNNNNGNLPALEAYGAMGGANGTLTVGVAPANTSTANLGYFTANNVDIVNFVAGTTTQSANTAQVVIALGASCNGTAAQAGSSRGYVALYTLDGGAKECQAS